jgi:cytoskeleton protein RodZ
MYAKGRLQRFASIARTQEPLMEKVANVLRQTREHQHMSLEEAAQRTRIPLSYLALLEGATPEGKGRTRPLPDPLYLVPHLRKYALFLGLDPGFMTAQFTAVLQDAQEKSVKIAAPSAAPDLLPPSPQRSRAISLSIVLASVLVTLAVIGQYTEQNTPTPAGGDPRLSFPANVASAPQPSPQAAPVPEESRRDPFAASSAGSTQNPGTLATGANSPPGNIPSASQQSDPSAVPTLAQRPFGSFHVLRAQATEATWIRIHMDGQSPKEMILRPGQSAEWTSNSPFQLTLGNAGGVTLNLDGQELPPLGKSGQVIRNMRLPALPPESQG